jgi:glycosyltransferase involved in cell wall biosynthesis
MHVLAVTTSFPLRPGASAGVFVRRLYEHLEEDWRIDVICPADDGARVETSDDDRIRLRPVRYAPARCRVLAQQSGGVASGLRRAPWRVLLAPFLLAGMWWRCMVEARRCDVLHANWAVCGAVAWPAAALWRRPLVTTLRGDDVARARRSALDRWLLHVAVRGSALIVCVSEAMARELAEHYPDRKGDIDVCLNGVDASFLAVVRSPPQCDRLRVGAVGSLIARKGYDVLLDAIARSACRDAIEVRIAGGGPELDNLRGHAARLGIAARVRFVGELAPAQIPGFLADADVFVLPSRSEGRPNAVIEALAAGLPVISSDLPGVQDLVVPGVNGWCVPVGDVAGLAAALDEAWTDPAGRERRAAAARRGAVRDGQTWESTGSRYASLFQRAVAIRGGAG